MTARHDEEREPDPDLSELVAATLAADVATCCEGALSPHHVEVLKQRTFLHLPGPSVRRALSACLARLHRLGHDHLVLFVANRPEGDAAWHVAGFNGGGRYPEKAPYAGYSLVFGGSALAVGIALRAPLDEGRAKRVPEWSADLGGEAALRGHVARVRVTLASGHAYEDRVANDALLLLVPFNEPRQWEGEALVQLFDRGGGEVASQRLWVGPESPPRPS